MSQGSLIHHDLLFPQDTRTCLECNALNSPMVGRCSECCNQRPGWLPDKVSKRKRRWEESECESEKEFGHRENDPKRKRSQELDSTDFEESNSGICTLSSQHSSQESTVTSQQSSQESTLTSQQSSQENITNLKDEENLTACEKSFLSSVAEISPTVETYRTLLNYQSKKSAIDKGQHELNDSKSFMSTISPQNQELTVYTLGQSQTTNENVNNLTSSSSTASVSQSGESQSRSSASSTVGAERSTQSWQTAAGEPCIICLEKPKTTSFVHGITGHQVCCHRCAKRLKRRGQPCPVCRRPIEKVTRNYFF